MVSPETRLLRVSGPQWKYDWLDGLWLGAGELFFFAIALSLPRGGSRLGSGIFECVTTQQSVHVELRQRHCIRLASLSSR